MAASRYWRIVNFRTKGGDLELSALHLYDAAGRVDATIPVSCSAQPTHGAVANLADTTQTTSANFAFNDVISAGFWFQWDFGQTQKDISYVRLGATVLAKFAESLLLLQSDNGNFWTVANRFEQYIYPGDRQMTQLPTVGALVVDPYLSSVVALLNFKGQAGSADFVDSTGRIWVSEGATLSHAASLDGTTSLALGSTLGISSSSSVDFDFGTGDVTVEAWVYQTSRSGGGAVFGGTHYQNVVGQNQIGTPYDSAFNLSLASGVPIGGFYITSADVSVIAPSPIPLNTWTHLALVKRGSEVTLFVASVPASSTAFNAPVNVSTRKIAVGMDSANSALFQGFIGGVRITRGARYRSSFTPEIILGGGGTGILESPNTHSTLISGGAALPGLSVTGAVVRNLGSENGVLRDTEHAGRGLIAGSVKVKHLPVDTPVKRRVRLINERSGLFVRETWSDAVTGDYRFEWIDESATYTVISYDHTDAHRRAVVADGLNLANKGVELIA